MRKIDGAYKKQSNLDVALKYGTATCEYGEFLAQNLYKQLLYFNSVCLLLLYSLKYRIEMNCCFFCSRVHNMFLQLHLATNGIGEGGGVQYWEGLACM